MILWVRVKAWRGNHSLGVSLRLVELLALAL